MKRERPSQRRSRTVGWEAVRELAQALPEAVESTSYGTPAFKVAGKLFVRLHQDGESIMFKVGFAARDHLIRADPQTFFTTEHYRNYPTILARRTLLDAVMFKAMLERRWRTVAPKKLMI